MTPAEAPARDDDDLPADSKLPPLSLIERELPGSGADLFVGDRRAASDPALVAGHRIAMMLNCAVNLDINVVTQAADPAAGGLPCGAGFVRYYKLGIVDGPGNPASMMLAGYYQLAGLLAQTFPDKPSYPRREKGNVLVLCRGGRSRSVTLAALFLHLERPERYPTLESALEHVSRARGLPAEGRADVPKPALIEAARWAAATARLIGRQAPP